MGFLNPFTSITSALKLVVVILCLAVGAFGTYKASHFVSDYYTYKNKAASEAEVSRRQAAEAAHHVGSDAVTAAAETGTITHDNAIHNAHDAQKRDVADRVAGLQKKTTKQPSGTTPGSSNANPPTNASNTTTDAPAADIPTQVSTIYITTLWANYCEASGDTGAQCKAAS